MTERILALWNFANPAESEANFRRAQSGAAESEAAAYQTQIARTYGIRRDFERAREELGDLRNHANAEVRCRAQLEYGRTLCSAAHNPKEVSEQDRELALHSYHEALSIAQEHRLDYLAIDALHMLAIAAPHQESVLKYERDALALIDQTDQPIAKKWEGSLRNNHGLTLSNAGRLEEALAQFDLSRAARERDGNVVGERIARWMIATTHREMGNPDEAIGILKQLESDWAAEGGKDEYVFSELARIFREQGNAEEAAHYDQLPKAARE